MSIERVYDFETAIENGFQTLFQAGGLVAATPSTALTFQQARPRVELLVNVGSAKLSYYVLSGVKRNASWTGQLNVKVITGTEDLATHRIYRAAVRNCMAQWETVAMDCHKLQNAIEQSTSNEYRPADGMTASELIYRIEFGIDSGAWVELAL